jgi:hypothetical protein
VCGVGVEMGWWWYFSKTSLKVTERKGRRKK